MDNNFLTQQTNPEFFPLENNERNNSAESSHPLKDHKVHDYSKTQHSEYVEEHEYDEDKYD